MRRWIAAVVLATLVAAASPALTAGAGHKKVKVHTKRISTRGTLLLTQNAAGPDTFTGRFTSGRPGCVRSTTFELFGFNRASSDQGDVDSVLVKTAADGSFSVPLDALPSHTYKAQIQKHLLAKKSRGPRKVLRLVCYGTPGTNEIFIP